MKITFEYTSRDTNLMKETVVTLASALKEEGVIRESQKKGFIAPLAAMQEGKVPETDGLELGGAKLSTHQQDGRTFVSYEMDTACQEELAALLCRHGRPIARTIAALRAVVMSLKLFSGIFKERPFQEMKKDFAAFARQ